MSAGVKVVSEAIQKLTPGQQITVLRNTVVDMGFESTVAPGSEPTAEPMFERSEPDPTMISVEGVKEPAVLSYLEAMADDFEASIALFTSDGALQPPFQKPLVGSEAIARYIRAEAQGLNITPKQGVSEALPNGSKQIKVTGVVQPPWFGVNIGMDISWRFLINPEGKIFCEAIDMLAP